MKTLNDFLNEGISYKEMWGGDGSDAPIIPSNLNCEKYLAKAISNLKKLEDSDDYILVQLQKVAKDLDEAVGDETLPTEAEQSFKSLVNDIYRSEANNSL